MLLAVALPFFTSCSDDDDVNTAETTVGFENTELVVDESAGLFNIPINVTGRRNGPIHLTLAAEGVGDNPAVEGENFQIIDKTLNLSADTLETGTINVEVQIFDDIVMNANRQFTLTIVDADGAEITNNRITVSVMNNDGYYTSLFGEWTLNAESARYGQISCDVTIGGAEDENDPAYERTLDVSITNLLGSGETLNFAWNYVFDSIQGMGQVALTCDQSTIATLSDGSALFLVFDPVGDGSLYTGSYPGVWYLGENGEAATSIIFPYTLYNVFYNAAGQLGAFDIYSNVTLTRK